MATPLSLPGAKATLILSLAMTVLGVAGVASGYGELAGPAVALEAPAGASEAARAAADTVRETLTGHPLVRGLGAANLVVSALLVLASFTLTLRRPTALWWCQQAIVANALFAIGKPIVRVMTLLPLASELVAIQDDPSLTAFPAEMVTSAMQGGLTGWFVLEALILLAVYFILFRLARRDTVRAFVSREPG
ncbi:MAG: hypothetical protein VYE22_14385 [Myxococcota bacterium]|nr:hypothetical protein [Myxococcota bacterium]